MLCRIVVGCVVLCCVVVVGWGGVVWCGVVWCGVVWCGVVWCGVVWCGVVWCGVVLCVECSLVCRAPFLNGILMCNIVYSNPQPPIRDAVALALRFGWSGYNVDFEPGCWNQAEAEGYFGFMATFADALHKHNLRLVGDLNCIAHVRGLKEILQKSPVDRWVSMDTYTSHLPMFYDNVCARVRLRAVNEGT